MDSIHIKLIIPFILDSQNVKKQKKNKHPRNRQMNTLSSESCGSVKTMEICWGIYFAFLSMLTQKAM